MTNIGCYALRQPDEYKRFRRMVRNIVDWGRDDRLKAIQHALDQLLEEAQKRTSRRPASPPRRHGSAPRRAPRTRAAAAAEARSLGPD